MLDVRLDVGKLTAVEAMKAFSLVGMTNAVGEGIELVAIRRQQWSRRCGGAGVRLQSGLDRVQRILEAISAPSLNTVAFKDDAHTAVKVERRLLELAATSVRYFLVHRFACSLRNTALDTSVRSLGLLGMSFCTFGLPSSCLGILAIASCGRQYCLPTAIAIRPAAGQAP
jgi:hypothetical protein